MNTANVINNVIARSTARQERPLFKNMSELRKKNKAIGHKFFSREMMKAYNSKVETTLLRGRFFVMSEQDRKPAAKRKFKLWEAKKTGEVVCVNFGTISYPDLDSAKEALRDLVRQGL